MSGNSLIRTIAVVVSIGVLAVSASRAWPYEEVEVKDGGKVLGEVKVSGDVSPPEKLTVNKDGRGAASMKPLERPLRK